MKIRSIIFTAFLILPAVFFLFTGFQWLVSPDAAASALMMPLLDGAGRSSQISDIGGLFLGMGLTVMGAVVTRKGDWLMPVSIILACIAGPILQEIFKIMVPLWIVEKRPYFFTSWFQFFVFALVTATVFASVTNFFLSLAVEEVSMSFFIFQWVGILGLNLITAAIATQGLETIWRNTINSGKPPRLDDGYPYFATAIGLHIAFAVGTTIWFAVTEIGNFFHL